MGFGQSKTATALAGYDDPALEPIREQAHGAKLARRKTFVARLPLGDVVVGDVPFWAAAIQQVEQHGFKLEQWTVCPEAQGPVGYAFFRAV